MQNELILEFPTKSMPSGFCAAAILDHWRSARDRTGDSASPTLGLNACVPRGRRRDGAPPVLCHCSPASGHERVTELTHIPPLPHKLGGVGEC